MTADVYPLQVLLVTLAGWINRHQQHVIEYLVEENRVLEEQVGGRARADERLDDPEPDVLQAPEPNLPRPPASETNGAARDQCEKASADLLP